MALDAIELSSDTTSLKDLSAEDFERRYSCDRFTASVMANRFRYLVNIMSTQLISSAFSPILRDATDLSAAMSGPPEMGYPMPAVAQTIPLFFGSIPEAVRISVEEFGLENLVPGDVIVVNDPYRAGTHVNDVCFIRPVFVDGKIIGTLTLRAHMLDWGGKTQGGFALDKASLFEDGLVLAPELIYHAGEPVRSIFKIIRDNTRFSEMVVPDIQTINDCLIGADRLLRETYTRYGHDAYCGAIKYACDASAEKMRDAISTLPDGDFKGSSQLDSNGLGGIETASEAHVVIRKRGTSLEVDFSGTSEANASSLNCMWQEARTAVVIALKWLIDPTTPYTSGACREIDVLVPPNCFLNPSPPYCSNLYWIPVHAAMTAVMRALNPILGENAVALDSGDNVVHSAIGTAASGETPWYAYPGAVLPAVPWGASKQGDGDASQLNPYINVIFGGDEPAEADMPLVVWSRDYLTDSGGPGYYRGGASGVADSYWPKAGHHSAMKLMSTRQDTGVIDGKDGVSAGGWIFPPHVVERYSKHGYLPHDLPAEAYADAVVMYGRCDPQTHAPDPSGAAHLILQPEFAGAGCVVRNIPTGGGGWGDPFKRPAEKVLEDVRNEYVSIAGAKRDYCVVITGDPQLDPEGLQIDREATARLRASA